MTGLASRETLDGLFLEVKTSRTDDAKEQAASTLRQYVDAAHRDLQSGEFSSHYDDILQRMSALVVHGQDTNERISGIMVLTALIDFRGDDAGYKTTRFSNNLRAVLRGNDIVAMGYAAEALGKLVAPMGTLTSDLVESEIKTAIESLQTERKDQENRRLAAVMVLRELARHAPTIVHAWVGQIFEAIWLPLRDSKPSIRDAAAEAVRACVDILAVRDTAPSRSAINQLFEHVSTTLRPGAPAEAVHGGLLVVKAMLGKGGVLMDSNRYRDAVEWVLSFRDHRDSMVRREAVRMMPQLAVFSPSEFSSRYLARCMQHLGTLLKREKERAAALRAVGGIADAVGSNIAPHIDEIVGALHDGLAGRIRQPADAAVFECLGTVSAAVGQALGRYVAPLLDALFQTRLTAPMASALVAFVQHIPSVKPAIQIRLLDLISEILCGRPFRTAVGGNGGSGRQGISGPTSGGSAGVGGTKEAGGVGGATEAEIALALDTLGTFDFGPQPLGEFVRTVVVKFVDADATAVRREAALACCRLFGRDPVAQQTGAHAQRLVGDVVGRLVAVGVADSEPNTRLSVLRALPVRFDRQLGRPEHVRSLVLAVHDGPLAVREAAVAVLGRIVSVNPATVLPSLRKALVQLLTEVEYASHSVAREEAARLVGGLVSAGPGLVRPYAWAVAEVLLPRADDASAAVAATALDALGKLTGVGGAAVSDEVVSRLMLSIVSNMKESGSAERRLAALGALGRLAENCSYVIQPFVDQPELAGLLHGIVRSEGVGAVRRETVRVLGVLGAIDPDVLGPSTSMGPTTPAVDGAEAANTTATGIAVATAQAAAAAAVASGDGGASSADGPADMALLLDGMSPSSDEYYPSVCIQAFTSVLSDPQLAQYHPTVIEGMMNMFTTLGLRCVPFLDKVVPGFITVIEAAPVGRVEGYFAQLAQLVRIVRNHIRPFLTLVLSTVEAHWVKVPSLRATLLGLVDASARAVEGEFGRFLAPMLKLLLAALDAPDSPIGAGPSLAERIVREFGIIAPGAEQYLPLIIPAVVSTAERPGRPIAVRRAAIETLNRLARKAGICEFASRIVHGLCSVISTDPTGALRPAALDAMCALVYRLGSDFLPFAPTVGRGLAAGKIIHPTYSLLVQRLSRGQPLPPELNTREDNDPFEDATAAVAAAPGPAPRAQTNQQHLRQSWVCTRTLTAEDWTEWVGRLCLSLVRESPQPAMRACAPLVRAYSPLGRRLFNSAFVSCWPELYEQYQEELVASLEVALTSPTLPPDILQLLLNLAEFMEHDDKPLPIDVRLLGLYAHQCHAFAKALHYKELEFNTDQRASAVEALISLNNHLHQSDAAVGILRRAHDYGNLPVREHWYERLYRWDDALAAYRRRENSEGATPETTIGQMRCLHALGEWDVLSSIAQEKWLQASPFWRRQMAPLAAAAAWGLGRWELMDRYVGAMKVASPDRAFFSAILAIHRHQFAEAGRLVERARSMLETELFALLAESYERAYLQVLRLQMLAELDEIMVYKRVAAGVPDSAVATLGPGGNPIVVAPSIEPPSARLATMRNTWERRLRGCQPNPEVWQRMMKVRSLVLGPSESMGVWVRYANLCRRNGRMGLAEKALRAMLGTPVHPSSGPVSGVTAVAPAGSISAIGDTIASRVSSLDPAVAYAALKFLWASGERPRALSLLQEFTSTAEPAIQATSERSGNNQSVLQENSTGIDSSLLARCFLKQGRWLTADPGDKPTSIAASAILTSYASATRHNGSWHKAWHALALAHFELVMAIVRQQRAKAAIEAARGNAARKARDPGAYVDRNDADSNDPDPDAVTLPPGVVRAHVVPAVNGFFRAIALSPAHALQNALRVITLWFAHGRHADVIAAVMHGLGSVTVDTWLDVIPQILARINQPNRPVRETIHRLLTDLGRAHPQAVVFPFIVALKSDTRRSRAALALMDSMKLHSPSLVDHADLVSRELIRLAVLWHEQWFEGLEDASRLYFGDHDIAGMFATLKPLHDMLDREPETLREISFIHTFGRELHEARRWCVDFHATRNAASLNQAWDLYYQVFKKLQRQLTSISTLEFQYVSPRLQVAKDLDLAVPGTYRTGRPVVTIASFNPVAVVFVSKQRPRKFSLVGSDGVTYQYILKGHEDIRQDERVMQLFGLCNTLLAGDGESRKRQLHIQRFAVIPLSTSSGLLGFVPNSDTFHTLIRSYRESRKILINIEQRIMLQMAPDYDSLTLLQKVEVFSYALDNTTGQDLYRVLWLKSRSSEAWLVRRTNYTRSLAVMSIVGYLLGLGDRHPSNLMMDRFTGQVIHIDLGDCFESAMQRDKYPEQVPFRLTRMLTYAMEVSNIEGSYRISAEHTMRVLRQNRDSVVAVMEAFVHDPLITWRVKKFTSADIDFTADVTGTAASTTSGVSTVGNVGGTQTEEEAHHGYRPFRRASVRQRTLTNTANVTGNARRTTDPLTGAEKIDEEDLEDENQQSDLAAKFAAVSGAAAAAVAGAAGDAGVYSGRPGSATQAASVVGAPPGAVGPGADNPRPGAADPEIKEVRNAHALQVISRLKEKLNGRDFPPVDADDTGSSGSSLTKRDGLGFGAEFGSLVGMAGLNSGMSALHLGATMAMASKGLGAANGAGLFGEVAGADGGWELPVDAQVDRLIREATSLENLCQHFIGWCAFW